MDSQSTRYAPMNRSHIPGFPNRLPHIDWQTYLPKFKDEEGDDVALHLIKFHMHVHKLKVKFHEYCLMNMFMASLEGKERSWYENLPAASICSLKDFHTVFFEHFKESCPLLLLVENCCEHFESFIQYLEDVYDDDVFMDHEIIESLQENPFHHKDIQENVQQTEVFPSAENEKSSNPDVEFHVFFPEFDEHIQQPCQMSCNQEEAVETSCYGNQDNFQQIIASPLAENVMDQHIDESHVSSPEIGEDLQQVCQFLCDQKKDQGSQTNCSSILSFLKLHVHKF
jgi:hypothetical protein